MDIQLFASIAESVASVLALIISCISLVQSHKQIDVSNKQALFDRRLKLYELTFDLYKSFGTYKTINSKTNGSTESCSGDFILLAIDSVFAEPEVCIAFPTQTTSLQSMYKGLQTLDKAAGEARFIFDEAVSRYIADFIESYSTYLFHIYHYEEKQMKELDNILEAQANSLESPTVSNRYLDAVHSSYETVDSAYCLLRDNNILGKVREIIKLY